MRCRAFQEYIEQELLTLAHVKGQFQVADLLTKALSPPRVCKLLDYLDVDLGNQGGTSKWASTSPERGNLPPAARSLLTLSCFMSPVTAQPNANTYEIRWSWFLLCYWLSGFCGVLLGLFLAGWKEVWKRKRLQGLRLEGDKLQPRHAEAAGSLSPPEMEEGSKHGKGPPPCLLAKPPTVKPPPPKLTPGGESGPNPKMPVKRPPSIYASNGGVSANLYLLKDDCAD